MTTAAKLAPDLDEIVTGWREARRIYPVYAALIRQFDLGISPNAELESPINRSEPEVLLGISRWFDAVDAKSEVWQLRQVLQTAAWVNDDQLRAMAVRHLGKPHRDARVRDKVDYLLVQCFSHQAPLEAHTRDISFKQVADALVDVIGQVSEEPDYAGELEAILADLRACSSLSDLLSKHIIERSRFIKEKLGEQYFEPSSLAAITGFNFKVRFGFFRTMHADLNAIRATLDVLQGRGQSACDLSQAGLSKNETLVQVRKICDDWKKPFQAAYSVALNFKQIISLRQAMEEAVRGPVPIAQPGIPAHVPPAHRQNDAPKAQTQRAPEPGGLFSVDECIEQIAERLLKTAIKNASVTNLMFGELKVLLASWEVQAFIKGGDDAADTMQRAVAARIALNLAMQAKKLGRVLDISGALTAAHAEAALIQERIAEAKEKKNIDAAVNLAATSKRLLSLAAEAEKQERA